MKKAKIGFCAMRRRLIVAHAPKDLAPATVSTYLALEYVELYATRSWYRTCWAGCYAQVCASNCRYVRVFEIPADRTITGFSWRAIPNIASTGFRPATRSMLPGSAGKRRRAISFSVNFRAGYPYIETVGAGSCRDCISRRKHRGYKPLPRVNCN